MAILDFLTGRQQQPMGGIVGQLQQPQPQAQRGIMGDQGFLQSLARLGAALGPNLAAASTNNENFLDALSLATAQTAKEQQANEASMLDRQVKQAQIRKLEAEAQPGSPFSGTGFENQVAGTYYQAYLAQGMSPMEAQVKAAQAVFNREPTYIQNAEGQLIPIPGRTLPNVLGGAPAPSATPAIMPAAMQTPAVQDPIDQTAAALGLPTGALLPPPSGTQPTGAMPTQGVLPAPSADVLAQTGMPRGNLIQAPAAPGPKTAQALAEEAGKAEIGVQGKFAEQLADIEANRLKGLREQASTLNARAPDMERLALAIQRYGDTGTLGDLRLTMNKIGSDFGVANPDRVAEGELIKQITSKIAPQMRPEGSGAASDKDMKLFMDSLPNLMTTGPGAAKGYQYFERVRQYQNAIANEAENYAYNNRTMRGFNEHLEKLKKDGVISLWTPEERNQLQAIAKGTSTQNAGLPQPTTKADFDKLPSGAQFLDPNGVLRRKP